MYRAGYGYFHMAITKVFLYLSQPHHIKVLVKKFVIGTVLVCSKPLCVVSGQTQKFSHQVLTKHVKVSRLKLELSND